MKFKYVTLFACCLMLFCSGLFAEEKKAPEQMNMNDPMMKAWMEFATPGAPHKGMQGLVGTWNTVVKSTFDPAHPMESKGTSTYTSLMDGRYIQENAQGDMMGMPFHGMGIYGYDNLKKKYVGTWIDNMGTGLMTSEGTSTDGGKTINWSGTSSDPMSGKEQTYRSVMHMMSDTQYHFEMFGPGPDGKEMKMLDITGTKAK